MARSTVTDLLKDPRVNENYWLAVSFDSLDSMIRSVTSSITLQLDCQPLEVISSTPCPDCRAMGQNDDFGKKHTVLLHHMQKQLEFE